MVSIWESAVRKSVMSHTAYRKRTRGRNRNTTLLLRCEDCDFTRRTRRHLLHLGRRAHCAHRASVRCQIVPRCRQGREAENPNLAGSGMSVVLLPVAGSGGGRVYRPSPRCLQHAEGPGEIETDGECGRLRLAQSVRPRHPRPGERRRGRWWPTAQPSVRVGLRRRHRRLLDVLLGVHR